MRKIYVKTRILGMACIDESVISMRAKGTVEIGGRVVPWEANFTSTWKFKFERVLENEKTVSDEIANLLGHIAIPMERTFTYDGR